MIITRRFCCMNVLMDWTLCVPNFRRRSLDYMQDPFIFRVDAINNSSAAKRPRVCRLPAASRIERSAIQGDRDLAVVELAETGDDCIEFEEAWILIIKSLGRGHGDILVRSSSKKQSADFADYSEDKQQGPRSYRKWLALVLLVAGICEICVICGSND